LKKVKKKRCNFIDFSQFSSFWYLPFLEDKTDDEKIEITEAFKVTRQ